MHFMNRWEVDEAAAQTRRSETYRKLALFIQKFKDRIDSISDGWAHWPPPVRACSKAFTILENREAEPTEDEVKKSLRPIKSFCTKRKIEIDFPY